MNWRDLFDREAAARYDAAAGPSYTPCGAAHYVRHAMLLEAANDVALEIRADCDTVAMMKAQARLSLMLAWATIHPEIK